MISASDILKILDKVPEWVGLKRLLARVDTLEKKVAELEARLAEKAAPKAEACPLCGGAMKVTAAEPDPMFGIFGVEERTLTCQDCEHVAVRQFDPKKA